MSPFLLKPELSVLPVKTEGLTKARSFALGPVQAERAQARYQTLGAPERAQLNQLLADIGEFHDRQGTDAQLSRVKMVQAFAEHGSPQGLRAFWHELQNLYDEEIIATTTLADPTPSHLGAQDELMGSAHGLRQQNGTACSVSRELMLMAELDPVMALRLRTQGDDVHDADDGGILGKNRTLGLTEATLLGELGRRDDPMLYGMPASRNGVSEGRGLKMDGEGMRCLAQATEHDLRLKTVRTVMVEETADRSERLAALAAIRAQVEAGIPTRIHARGHAELAPLLANRDLPPGELAVADPWGGTSVILSFDTILDRGLPSVGRPDPVTGRTTVQAWRPFIGFDEMQTASSDRS